MAPHDDTQYIGLPTRNPDGGPESPHLGLDSPRMPSSPMLNDPYTPPLGHNSHLQPSPSFLTAGNRDSSYANSLNSEAPMAPGARASWGSNALLNPNVRHDSYAGSSSPLARNGSDDNITASPDPAFAPQASPRSPRRSKRTSATSGLALGTGAAAAAVAAQDYNRNPSTEDELDEKPRWAGSGSDSDDKPRWAAGSGDGKKKRRWLLWSVLLGALLAVIALAVGLGVHFGTKKKDSTTDTSGASSASDNNEPKGSSSSSAGSKPSSTSSGRVPLFTGVTTGTDGSQVLFSNGSTVTYKNRHGGKWAYDPSNPMINDAQPNSWTPPLSQSWDWEQRMFGVNLGGWFVTEPFIVPALYETYTNGSAGQSVDEFTLSQNMGDQVATIMEEHYNTFITEEDFMEMADAGLNWIRLPIGFWALETFANEPFLEGVAWKYIVQALGWARKYGLRVKLDLHATPGSANGWNHSGRIGQLNFLQGVMGLANAQRTLDYIGRLAEFINQPEWKDVVPVFGIINEPRAGPIGQKNLGAFYIEAHDMIRNITGYGEGKGAYISIFEGFIGVDKWYTFGQSANSGFDRVNMDIHQYTCFQDQDPRTIEVLADRPCQWWAAGTNTTRNAFGVTLMGEASVAWNDCGHWLNEVGKGSRYDGTYPGYENKAIGSCDVWNNDGLWNASVIAAYTDMMSATQDSLFSWFFWTWKIGASTIYDYPVNTPWHYKRLLELGIASPDPRNAIGHCLNSPAITPVAFNGYKPYQTGGAGAGTVPPADRTAYPWPLDGLAPTFGPNDMSDLPQYTRTGTPVVLANPTGNTQYALASSAAAAMPTTTIGAAQAAWVAVAGCDYPNEYSAESLAMPSSACGAGQTGIIARRAVPTPAPTPAAR